MTAAPSYAQSQALYERAGRTIAGRSHLSGRPLLDPERSPLYFERAKGCRIRDVDGNEYIDYLMAYGAVLLGYAHEEVDRAAFEQVSRGSLISLNHRLHLDFVDALLERFPAAESAIFFKTGSDATTAALRIARRATGRRKVVRCGYHGWHDWCVPLEDYVPAGLDEQVLEFDAKRPASLGALFDEHPGEIAAVIVAPEMVHPPDREAFVTIAETTRAGGAVFVLDEVKTAFRTRPGAIQHFYDLRPDITTVSKALGNGWPVAAALGTRAVMDAASGMHLSATYHGDTAPMAAALTTLAIIDREGVQDYVWRMGERLIAGFTEIAHRRRLPAEAYGEPLPPMPFFHFTHRDPAARSRASDEFYTEVLARGVLLHPRHLWYISHAHSQTDIDRTLEVVDEAMAALARRCPNLVDPE